MQYQLEVVILPVAEENRISGRWEASDDRGATWRKDFDLTFERRAR